jgi:DNA modification methylase
LDPFAGSGSSLVAAQNLGRTYYGFDIVKEYCEIAQERLADVDRPSAARTAG